MHFWPSKEFSRADEGFPAFRRIAPQAMTPMNPEDWERCYRDLAHLIETMPGLHYKTRDDPEVTRWLGRVYALIDEIGEISDSVSFKTAIGQLTTGAWQSGVTEILTIVYRAWAIAERKAPASVAGSFIPAGGQFDAFVAVGKVFKTASTDLLIVDPYLDDVVLTDFAIAAPEGVSLRLLSDAATAKAPLQPAAARWVHQHGPTRPLELRLAAFRTLHDRAFFVDRSAVWLVSQSLNAIAARSSATIERANETIAKSKIPAYEQLWATASVIVLR
jgi:hypothetical protein